jgi:hypothetical protein
MVIARGCLLFSRIGRDTRTVFGLCFCFLRNEDSTVTFSQCAAPDENGWMALMRLLYRNNGAFGEHRFDAGELIGLSLRFF